MNTAIQDTTLQLLPAKKKATSSGWTSFNSVCCTHNGESADTRGRGGVTTNPEGGVSYHCFNCGFKTGYQPGRHLSYKFRKLLNWLGADENTVRRLVIEAVRVKELVAPESVKIEPTEEVTFKKRHLPAEAQTFYALNTFYTLNDDKNVPKEYHDAVTYCAKRNINLTKYDFYWTAETAYNLNKRVIIPFSWKNEIIGYTARALYDDIKPKYFNSHEPNYVFNVDRQLPDAKFVVVCEGPFDAMSIDGVAVLGSYCNEIQADIIDGLAREVVLVPDNDPAGKKLVDQAVEYGWTVSFPEWLGKHKDINSAVQEYGKLYVLKSILAAKETSRLKIELRKKKLSNT